MFILLLSFKHQLRSLSNLEATPVAATLLLIACRDTSCHKLSSEWGDVRHGTAVWVLAVSVCLLGTLGIPSMLRAGAPPRLLSFPLAATQPT